MRVCLVKLMVAVAFPTPVVAHADDTAAPAPKKEKKICHLIAVTGSIIGTRRTCLTAAEWTAIEGRTAGMNARGIDDVLNKTSSNPAVQK